MQIYFRTAMLTMLSFSLFAQSTTNGPTAAEIVATTVARLTRLLTLTTAQAATATTLFTTEVAAVQTAEASQSTAVKALTSAIEANNAGTISTEIAQIVTGDTQILQAEATADAGLYFALSSTQQTIYAQLLALGLDAFGNFGGGLGCLPSASSPGLTTTTFTPPTIAELVAARVARLTTILKLTSAQVASATALFTTEVTAEQAAQTSLRSAQAALLTAVEANSTTGIASALSLIGPLDTTILHAQATADASFYASLTSTQQAIDMELLAAGLDDAGNFGHVGGGPGGPGGGGPGGGHGGPGHAGH